jgi:hypothetical protein
MRFTKVMFSSALGLVVYMYMMAGFIGDRTQNVQLGTFTSSEIGE